jgi:hypothetical protein
VVRFENQFYQLQPPRKAKPATGKVRVQRYLNGELHFRYGEQELRYALLPERAATTQQNQEDQTKTQRSKALRATA